MTSIVEGLDALTFTWAEISCGNRSGVITQYHYQLEYENGTTAREDVVSAPSTNVTLDDLFPCLSYIFRIAGTTSVGDGPYSEDKVAVLAGMILTILRNIMKNISICTDIQRKTSMLSNRASTSDPIENPN